jgi:hypothetical protein
VPSSYLPLHFFFLPRARCWGECCREAGGLIDIVSRRGFVLAKNVSFRYVIVI